MDVMDWNSKKKNHILLIKNQLFLFEIQIHTQKRVNEILTQRHSTISLKNYGKF